jgi:Superinfection immunity protein
MKILVSCAVLFAVILLIITDSGTSLHACALLTVAFAVYFLPALVAWHRRHQHTMAIFVTNLFLGWTFIGWVVALVWACMNTLKSYAPAQQAAVCGLGE